MTVVFPGCANPLNRATYDRYMRAGWEAETRGELPSAEEAYRRAYLNTQWGHLSDEEAGLSLHSLALAKEKMGKHSEAKDVFMMSEKAWETAYLKAKENRERDVRLSWIAYDLAMVKRDLCKWDEAESLLREALSLEEKVKDPDPTRLGKRLCELAHLEFERGRHEEAARYFDRCMTTVDVERLASCDSCGSAYATYALGEYAQALKGSKRSADAVGIEAKAVRLKRTGVAPRSPWFHVACQ